jgi:hypothetical protein
MSSCKAFRVAVSNFCPIFEMAKWPQTTSTASTGLNLGARLDAAAAKVGRYPVVATGGDRL